MEDNNTAIARGSDSSPSADITDLMRAIRDRVRQQAMRDKDSLPQFVPTEAGQDAKAERQAGELYYSEERKYLNAHYDYARLDLDSISSHRPFIGSVIVKLKRKFLSFLWNNLLRGYFEDQREYNKTLVKFLNEISYYVDARDSSNFWELIKKIDVDINRVVRRVEELSDEQVASLRSAETEMREGVAAALSDIRENLRTLNTAVARQDAELTMMDSVARGLERIVASMQGKVSPTEQASNVSKESSSEAFASKTDTDYLMLENRYRGSREEIARRLQIYPAMFSAASDSVLEIGPGRGELLQLFKEAGVSAYGVDINAAMSRCGREDGLIVETGDAVEHMRGLKDSSLSGVIAIQVIEHLSMSTLRELLSLCLSKVAPGGKVVFETINSESIVALTQHYFRDPTHVWPLHPETMRFAMEMAGFDVLEVRKLEPFPEAAQLASMPIEEYMTPRWVNLMHGINRNFELLNNILFGHQDYCIVALVPARQGSQ